MNLIEKLTSWGLSIGVISAVAGYLITFLRSKLYERRLQRREIQFMHNSLNFILFLVITPFILAFALLDSFPIIINERNVITLSVVLIILIFLQLINSVSFMLLESFPKKRTGNNVFVKWYSKYQKVILTVSFLLAISTVFIFSYLLYYF